MIIEKAEITNFLTIGEAEIHLDNRGLVLVQGENKDDSSANSNGAGKSSLTDAIAWCWYGTTARGESGDQVVNRTAGKNCRVITIVRDGDERYQIARHRKHKEGKNSLTLHQLAPEERDLTKGTDKLTQAEVNRILGSSEEVFNAAVYAGQEKMPDLPAMTDKPLKMLIEEAAGITLLERAYEVARTRAGTAKSNLDIVAVKRDRLKAKIEQFAEQIESLSGQKDAWEDGRKRRIDEATAQARACLAESKRLEDEIAGLDEAGVRDQLADCQRQIDGVKTEIEEKARRESEIGKVSSNIAVAKNEMARLAGDAKTQKAGLDKIDSRVGSPCGECGKEYEAGDLAEAKRLGAERLKGIVALHGEKKGELAELEGTLEALNKGLAAWVRGMTDISAATALASRLSASLREIDAKKASAKHERDRARMYAEQAKKLKDEGNPFDASIAGAVEQREQAEKELEEIAGEIEVAQAAFDLADAAVKVFGPAGVRAHILDTVTPFLNERTAHYLGSLSDGNISAAWTTLTKTAKGELREKFAIEVTNDTGAESFKGLSGGEKRKVRLACALALQDLVASRATKPIGLWIGDEIDAALDTSGMERLMAILEEKARERGTVLVVSHSDLKDWVRETVVVTKEGGKSTVKGVLCHA